jgi:hypothetical protein
VLILLAARPTGAQWLCPLLYDHTMDAHRADALHAEVLRTFSSLMAQDYAHLCLGISDRYLRAMAGWEQFVPTKCAVTITDGSMGTKLGQLRAWLEGREWTKGRATGCWTRSPTGTPGGAGANASGLRPPTVI